MTTAQHPDLHESLRFHEAQTECYVAGGQRNHVWPNNSARSDTSVRCQCGQWTRAERERHSAARVNGTGIPVTDIIRYAYTLRGIQYIKGDVTDEPTIRGVKTDAAAGPDDMTWLSAGALAYNDLRLIGSKAGLLVVPHMTHDFYDTYAGRIIVASDPKAVFTQIVLRYFPGLVSLHPWVNAPERGGPHDVIGPGVKVTASQIIGRNVTVGPNTCITNATIGKNVRIGANCSIGLAGFGYAMVDGQWTRFPHLGRVIIEDDVEIGSNVCIDRGALGDTIIRRGAKIDNLVHIAHNVEVCEHALVIAGAVLCGGVIVGANARIAPNAVVREQLRVGKNAVVGLGAVVVKDVPDNDTVVGNPARTMEPK